MPFNLRDLFVNYAEFKATNPRKWWWPLISIALVISLWITIGLILSSASKSNHTSAASRVLLHQEETLGQVTKFIEKVNLVGQFMEYEYTEGNSPEQLAIFSKKIIHADSDHLWTISFVNQDNIIVNSNNPARVGAYFEQNMPSFATTKWSVVQTPTHSLFSVPTIHFVRKLANTPKNAPIRQVISIAINDLLYETRFMLDQGLMALLSTKGDLLVSNGVLSLKEAPNLYTSLDTVQELTTLPPKFFSSKESYIVAWTLPENIPLVLITGFPVSELHDEYNSLKTTYYIWGSIATAVLLMLGFLATMMYCKLIQQQLKKQELESAYRSATECAMDGFFILNAVYENGEIKDFIVQDCNRRGASMLGLNKQKLIRAPLSALVSFDLFQRLLRKYQSTMNIGIAPPPDEFLIDSLKPAELRGRWVSHRCSYHKRGVAVTLRDITEEKANIHALTFHAEHDAVTGLPNRTWLNSHMPRYLAELKQRQSPAYFLFVDLDRFKYVNDTHGHDVGDLLLRAVGARLTAALRSGDIVTRIGGDEFVIAIYNNAENVNIHEICARLISEMHRAFDINGIHIEIGASIGVSLFPQHGEVLTDIMKHADEAMYLVKKSSKGAYKIFDEPEIVRYSEGKN